jgi:DNA (cytosine-5)-methyltransferase 1
MRQCDLFAGLGGFSLAASWFGIETTQFVEIEPFCQSLLAKNFPNIPIHDDITTYHPRLGEFDIITAGFPCQDLSSANPNGRGLEGERSGLFFEAMRIVRTVRPRFLLLENVPALVNRGLDRVLWEIAQSGFDAEWQVVSAASMGAPHRRERIFIIAYTQGLRRNALGDTKNYGTANGEINSLDHDHQTTPNPQSTGKGRTGNDQARTDQAPFSGNTFWQQNPHPEPTICPVDDGISRRLAGQQLKAIGNSVCPQAVAVAYQRIMEINKCITN